IEAGRTIRRPTPPVNDRALFPPPAAGPPTGLTRPTVDSILNPMVKYQDTALDRTFSALADPTRRALLAQLDRRAGVSISELARPFSMVLPAVMEELG